jgi:hypothetical protein
VGRTVPTVLLLATALVFSGCSGMRSSSNSASGQQRASGGYVFVPAGSAMPDRCRSTARALDYPVPCLSEVPRQMNRFAQFAFIGQGPKGPWRRWAVGSTNVGPEHLVTTASPRQLTNDARVVNGPAWYPRARVQLMGGRTINGWRMRVVYVFQATNDGSAFAHHVVLIWTVGSHTYGIGFHDLRGRRVTLLLDEELARHLVLVRP